MRRGLTFFFPLIVLLFTSHVLAQSSIPKLNFNELSAYLHQNNDTTYVVNFWATWCGPCVKELPHFEEINKKNFKNPVKVILVSLDFPEHFNTSLLPFIEKRGIKSQVLYLDDGRANQWIPKVDPKWSGAIPATLIYKGKHRAFYEQSFTLDDLLAAVEKINRT